MTIVRDDDAHEAMIQRIVALEKLLDQRSLAAERAIAAALEAVERSNTQHAVAHEREHQMQEIADGKLEKRIDDRFGESNRFREQIDGERLSYVRRDMLDQQVASMSATIAKVEDDIRSRLERMEADTRLRIEGESALRQRSLAPLEGQKAQIAAIIASVLFLGTLLGIVVVVINLMSGS